MQFDDNVKQIEEGLWDRTKARAAGVGGAISGAGQRIAGGVRGAVAGLKGDTAGAQAAAQQGKQGAIAGPVAKINSYKATAQKKIKALTDDILNDLTKLGININANDKVANGFIGTLNKGFDNLIQSLQGPTQGAAPSAPSGSTPPKLRSRSPSPATPTPPTTTPSSASVASPSPAPSTTAPTAPVPASSSPTGTTTTPSSPVPMDDKSIIDDLNKNKEQILGNDGLIGKAKFVAGQKGLGGSGKSGVELLKQGPSGDEGVEQAKAELAKKYNVAPEKLVELLGQVFTESRKHKKHINRFVDLYKKI